jgi:hypothetical protein
LLLEALQTHNYIHPLRRLPQAHVTATTAWKYRGVVFVGEAHDCRELRLIGRAHNNSRRDVINGIRRGGIAGITGRLTHE